MNAANQGSEGLAKAAAVENSASPGENSSKAVSRYWKIMLLAASLAGAWILGLVILALVAANPVTLNPMQIQHSDFVVTATRPDAKSSLLVVKKEWKHAEELGKIPVTNLDQTQMPAGGEFLVPLRQIGKREFVVTPTTLPNEAPLIYPATEEAQSQLQDLLQSRQ